MGHNGIWHKGNGLWATHKRPEDEPNIWGKYRPNLYDESLRVPFIVRWPGVVKAGSKIEQTFGSLDIYPTLLAMAGLKPPEGEIIRGRNAVPLLKGQNIDNWDNDFYAEYSMHHYCKTHLRAWRTPEWKLVRDFLNPHRDELYNLKDDPGETTNLIRREDPATQKIIAQLHQKIIARMKQINDPALTEKGALKSGSPKLKD